MKANGVPEMTEREKREVAWAIVRDSREMDKHGHARAVRWARAHLNLDEPPQPEPLR